MPVPETRRYGGREESYTSAYSRNGRTGAAYLSSTYTSPSSKFGSSTGLPPRGLTFDRPKFSDSIGPSASRFSSLSIRNNPPYTSGSSTYIRTSSSPVRAATSIYGRTTSTVSDRVKSLETDSTPTRYSRLRETSSSVNSKLPSTYTGLGFNRDRSGSRELGTSPLIGSSVSLASRELKSRSASIGPSASAPNGRRTSTTSSNGLSRLASLEVTQTNESSSSTSTSSSENGRPPSVCSSGDLTLAATATSASSGGQASKSNNEKCKDVENNDSFNDEAVASSLLASGTPSPTTITTSTTTTNSAIASHPSLKNSSGQASSLFMNGNNDNGNSEHSNHHVRQTASVRNKPDFATIEMNQDKNGNQISSELVNGFSDSQSHNNTNNFNNMSSTEVQQAPYKIFQKLPQTHQPKVIYHKIHLVESEDVSPPPKPVAEKGLQVQNGESTEKIDERKCHGNDGDFNRVVLVENGESTSPSPKVNIENPDFEVTIKLNPTAAVGKRYPTGVASASAATKLIIVQPGLQVPESESSPPPVPILEKLVVNRGRSKSPSPAPSSSKDRESPKSNLEGSLTPTVLQPAKSTSPPPISSINPRTSSPNSNFLVTKDESHHVEQMAGPHASKFSEEEVPGTSGGAGISSVTSRRGGEEKGRGGHYSSDSSENDSDAYTASPQLGGRFRSREKDAQCGLTGLRNIGNTCFMNSVLQCLSNTKPLLEYLLTDNYISDINTTSSSMKGALIRAFSNVIQELWRESRTVDTSAFKDQIQRFAPRFMGYSQQDAQEFLRYLLEGLHEEINRVAIRPKPIVTDIDENLNDQQKAMESWKRYLRSDDSKIVDIFVGQFKSTLKCTTCGHCSVTFDPFWDLSLPIPSRSNQTRLSQCLELFAKEETLDGDEKPTCAKCQTRRKCTKSLSIQRFPKVLVIHLKRFAPSERFRGKLSTTVEFPLSGLDMTPYAVNRAQGCSYNLYGISNHSGSTYSGHYIAYCKHPKTGEWNCYNDSRVSPISSQSVSVSEGYVLFYELANQSSHL